MRVKTTGKTVLLSPKEKLRRFHRHIFIFIIVAGVMNIFFPLVAHANGIFQQLHEEIIEEEVVRQRLNNGDYFQN